MSVKLVFFGDFVAQKSSDITISDEVKDMIASSDLAVCNFEAPIDGVYKAFERVGPRVKQTSCAPSLLKEWGFKAVQVANNHMLDYGNEGCEATLDAFCGIATIGAGTFDEAYSIKVVEIKGKTIGLLSCVHHEFGVWESPHPSQKMGTAWICHPLIQKRITEAKRYVDYLIVLPHAGVEEIDAPIPEWRELYQYFIDWGADAVIGTHPHVPQGWEVYKEKPIFYSLGNFYFDVLTGNHPFWKRSIAAELELDETGVSSRVYSICFENNYIHVDKGEDRSDYHKYLCDLLSDARYMDYCNQKAKELWKEYQNWLVRGVGAHCFRLGVWPAIKTSIYTLFKKRPSSLLVNVLQCESHRWTIIRAQRIVKD